MLDNDKAKILEKNIMKRIDEELPKSQLIAALSKAITKTIVIALQEYEKLDQD